MILASAPLPALSQSDGAEGFSVTSEALLPPPSDSSALRSYVETAERNRIATGMTYAIEIEGDITGGARREPREEPVFRSRGDGSALGVVLVVLVLIAALIMWMRFGGSGMLLARAPVEAKETGRMVAPDSWRIDADAARNPAGLLNRLAALPDRREAMVQLLRHCLLRAGDDSDTRFARSDTEREAFARLPRHWGHHAALNQLLRDTELVHYGGRDVTEDVFARAFDLGRIMLQGGRHAQ